MLRFSIQQPTPAPVLFTPVVNNKTSVDKPFIVGVAKNDSLIKVYIDNTFFGQFQADNHESGTANFAYNPFVALTSGPHFAYTEAIDSNGKISSWSNIVYFNVAKHEGAISEVAVEEKQDSVARIEEPEIIEEPTVTITPEEGTVDEIEVMGEVSEFREVPIEEEAEVPVVTEEVKEEEIKEILEGIKAEESEKTGLLNESKQKQGGLQLNLVIFIVFLLAVIAWIFWVNRELIKERQALTEVEDEAKKNKEIKGPQFKR